MKTNSWKCCVFLFSIYSGAWQKSHANRIELNCAQNHTKLEIRERAKDQKSERARKWVRCKHVHNTNNDSLQHGKAACRCTMKYLWKNAQLSLRSTTTKAKILKAAHANSHTYSHSQTHIRAHTDPAGGTRSAEYRSLSLPFTPFLPASAIAAMCASSSCLVALFFVYALLGLGSLPGGLGEQHPATADEGEFVNRLVQLIGLPHSTL